MPERGSFLVEEFIDAITVQLDRVQDALRLKAVNRPLTYAVKDFSLDLQVFVEMDASGSIRFRTSGPNEAGASTVHLGFTTITKPMIEENAISMAATRSPSLQQMGLTEDEQHRLERLGVRNSAQLRALHQSAGISAISRFAELPIDRLRQALALGKPSLKRVTPSVSEPAPAPAAPPLERPDGQVIRVAPGTRFLHMEGANLVSHEGAARVRLNQRELDVTHADEDHVIVQMPQRLEGGTLEVTLPDGDKLHYALQVQDASGNGDDWAPGRGSR